MLQKIYWCAKSNHKQPIFQQHDFPFNVYKSVANTDPKVQGLLMNQIEESPEYKFFHNIEFLLIYSK